MLSSNHLLPVAGIFFAAAWVPLLWERRRKKKSEAKRHAYKAILKELGHRHQNHLEPVDAVELMAVIGWKKRPTNRLLQDLCKEGFLTRILGKYFDGIRTADAFQLNPGVIDILRPYLEP